MSLMMAIEDFKGSPKNREEAIEQCVLANRILTNEGVLDAFGHVSVRNPENKGTFFQSRSLAPEMVTEEDILEIDLEGNVLTDTDLKPYGERIIHGAILKLRQDANSVFHGHPHSVIPFSTTDVPVRPIAHFASMFYEGVPVYDDYDISSGMLIASPEEGERVARALGQARGLLLRGHGCIVVGQSVQSMVMAAIFLRDNTVIQLQALQLGDPKYLSGDEAKQAARVIESALALERGWLYWVGRARRAMPDLNRKK
jgi:3-hydroxy-2-methylpyridine-4,5-dicarboxylate 4-decarboxylase